MALRSFDSPTFSGAEMQELLLLLQQRCFVLRAEIEKRDETIARLEAEATELRKPAAAG